MPGVRRIARAVWICSGKRHLTHSYEILNISHDFISGFAPVI